MGNMASEMLSYYHTQREVVKMKMEEGGCGRQFSYARSACDEWQGKRCTANTVLECREATAALRRCMACNEPHFRSFIAAMDKGLEEDEKRKWYQSLHPSQRSKWRWWTGMLRP